MDNEVQTLDGYLQNIYEHCLPLLRPQTRITILESKFDFNVGIGGISGGNTAIIHMDYTLYRNYEEEDDVYDYFAILSKVWVSVNIPKRDDASELKEKFELPNKDDNLLETGPGTKKRESSFSVGIGFGADVTGSLGYTVDLGANPNITRTENFSEDTVEWYMSKGGVSSLHNIVFQNSATWASKQSKKKAEIDISLGGYIQIMDGRFGQNRDYETIPVRFSYN